MAAFEVEHCEKAVSRRHLIAIAGIAAAAAAGFAACGNNDAAGETSEFGDGDVGILNYLLQLEHLEAALYGAVAASGLFKGADLENMQKIGEEEGEHVSALIKAVEQAGGDAATKPQTRFPLESVESALSLAAEIESLGAAAYLGQAANVESTPVLETMMSIQSVEARHATALRVLSGGPLVPKRAFAEPADVTTVLESVKRFIES